jgi:hypothetical protein
MVYLAHRFVDARVQQVGGVLHKAGKRGTHVALGAPSRPCVWLDSATGQVVISNHGTCGRKGCGVVYVVRVELDRAAAVWCKARVGWRV